MSKGLVIAATKSGSGKTTITLALMAALIRRGLKVAPFKVGPDFIDPGHHTRITSTVSQNLDGWMLPRNWNISGFNNRAKSADIAVVEGVMGLFDGYDGRSDAGSTAQMAKWTGLPVLLVVDAASMARSAAALVKGFEQFDPDLDFAGVLFNNIGSPRHLAYLEQALDGHVRMPCLGGVIRDTAIQIPERHLGLVTREEHELSDQAVERLADRIESSMDIDALIQSLPEISQPLPASAQATPRRNPSVRIGVARDRAFCFYYEDNLDLLAAAGAELVEFSPITDPSLPENLDGLYFGGGYPELFARQLAANQSLRQEIRMRSDEGLPIYGECGGFMYLCREITDTEGATYPMTGCFPMATRMNRRLRSLGYREITLKTDTLIGRQGSTVRGHEFHYSEIDGAPVGIDTVYRVARRIGASSELEGYRTSRTLGSYIHLHFGSRPEAADAFVAACQDFRRERTRKQ